MCFRHHLDIHGCPNLLNRACLYYVCVVQRVGGVVRHKMHAHFFAIIPPAIDYWDRWLTWMLDATYRPISVEFIIIISILLCNTLVIRQCAAWWACTLIDQNILERRNLRTWYTKKTYTVHLGTISILFRHTQGLLRIDAYLVYIFEWRNLHRMIFLWLGFNLTF